MWPFKRKKKEPNQLPAPDIYVRAERAGRVTAVETGCVTIDGKRYEGLKCTLVEPNRNVKEGQPLGKK